MSMFGVMSNKLIDIIDTTGTKNVLMENQPKPIERIYSYNKFDPKTKLFQKHSVKESELQPDDINFFARQIIEKFNSAPVESRILFMENVIPQYMEARKNMHKGEELKLEVVSGGKHRKKK